MLTIELALVVKALNNNMEVDTGIFNLVKTRSIAGAMTCKKLKLVGASFNPHCKGTQIADGFDFLNFSNV